jgi:hypothetical protein
MSDKPHVANALAGLENAKGGLVTAKGGLRLVTWAPPVLVAIGVVNVIAAFFIGFPLALVNILATALVFFVAQNLWRDRIIWHDEIDSWEEDIVEWEDTITFYAMIEDIH